MLTLSWGWKKFDDVNTDTPTLIQQLNGSLRKLAGVLGSLAGLLTGVGTFPDLAATPSVLGKRVWKVSNSLGTNITALQSGDIGQEVILWATTANTTLVHSAAFRMKSGANVAMAATDTRRFLTIDGVNWREV